MAFDSHLNVRETQMIKNTSVWTAVLTFTGVILGAILLSTHDRRADAAMLNAQDKFAIMTSGTNGGDEALIVVDKFQQKMVIYMLRGNDLTPMAGSSLR